MTNSSLVSVEGSKKPNPWLHWPLEFSPSCISSERNFLCGGILMMFILPSPPCPMSLPKALLTFWASLMLPSAQFAFFRNEQGLEWKSCTWCWVHSLHFFSFFSVFLEPYVLPILVVLDSQCDLPMPRTLPKVLFKFSGASSCFLLDLLHHLRSGKCLEGKTGIVY